MEIRKVLKKATAVAASASFIGATMLGAVAQDLANYPAPFVKDGVFDAFIVVGADAQPSDVVGAVDVGASLQFALKKTTTAGTSTTATISEGIKIEKSGSKFNFGQSINALQTTPLGEDDLPEILADVKYVDSKGSNKNKEDYIQRLLFPNNQTANLTFYQDDQDAPNAGDYLRVDDSEDLYNYSLDFDTYVKYDNASSTTAEDDLKTTTFTIQGQLYTITGVTLSGGKVDKLTLLSGDAVLWLTQNNPITKSVEGVEHTIEVLDVTETENACQLKVDDVTALIEEDETQTINGVQIGITDVRAIHAQLQDVDICQVSIGASEVILNNNDELEVDSVDQRGSKTVFKEGTGGQLEGFDVMFKPRDDLFLSSGDAYTDPIFKSWKLVYGGLTANYEMYSVETTGSSSAEFKFINNDGKEVVLPMWLNDSSGTALVGWGKDEDEKLLANGTGWGTGVFGQYACIGTNDVDDCSGYFILGVTSGGETHVFEIVDIDYASNKTDIRDVTYGRMYDDVLYTDEDAGAPTGSNLDLGSFGTISVFINETPKVVAVMNSVKGKMETNHLGSFNITNGKALGATANASISHFDMGPGNVQLNNVSIFFSELDRGNAKKVPDRYAGTEIRINLVGDTTDDEIDISTPTVKASVGGRSYDQVPDSNDVKVWMTPVGTKVEHDDENKDWLKIYFPDDEVYGNVFVAPVVATVSTVESGVSTYTLSKLQVGSAKLDSEISDASANNLIVVGGPCANRIAAQVLGVTYPACGAASGIAKDTAILKAVTQASGKVALVVAGWEAVDTRRATRVLSNYDQYDLSGSSVTITGTSLTDIQVSKSA